MLFVITSAMSLTFPPGVAPAIEALSAWSLEALASPLARVVQTRSVLDFAVCAPVARLAVAFKASRRQYA